MMDDTNLLFSPWFRLIVHKWMIGQTDGGGWWSDLKKTMTTNEFCDYDNIHRFDPPEEHMGGGGNAGPLFVTNKIIGNVDRKDDVNGDSS